MHWPMAIYTEVSQIVKSYISRRPRFLKYFRWRQNHMAYWKKYIISHGHSFRKTLYILSSFFCAKSICARNNLHHCLKINLILTLNKQEKFMTIYRIVLKLNNYLYFDIFAQKITIEFSFSFDTFITSDLEYHYIILIREIKNICF